MPLQPVPYREEIKSLLEKVTFQEKDYISSLSVSYPLIISTVTIMTSATRYCP